MEGEPFAWCRLLPAAPHRAFCFAKYLFGWNLHAAEIAGIALSTTSVAVVYAVMVETGLNREDIGKLILAACFVTDLGTVLALGGLFAKLRVAAGGVHRRHRGGPLLSCLACCATLANSGHRVSEPEVKVIFVVLLALAVWPRRGQRSGCCRRTWPVSWSRASHAGPVVLDRIRTFAFALLTPFFFLRSGRSSPPRPSSPARRDRGAVRREMVTKFIGVWPTRNGVPSAQAGADLTDAAMPRSHLRIDRALFRLTNHPHRQGPVHRARHGGDPLGFLPTLIAQQFFQPS